MGVLVSTQPRQTLLDQAVYLMESGKPGLCVTPNAQMLHLARRDACFRDFLNSADISLPDGAGTLLAANILGKAPLEKIPGVEFGQDLCREIAHRGLRLYLLGGKPGIAERAAENLRLQYPGLIICGCADGYFHSENAAAAALSQSRPDCVFVCMGCPRQEEFIRRHRSSFGSALVLPLGGSLDIYAGTISRAPRWMIRANLEWLYRLLQQPMRLRRMLFLPLFIVECYMEKRKNKHG